MKRSIFALAMAAAMLLSACGAGEGQSSQASQESQSSSQASSEESRSPDIPQEDAQTALAAGMEAYGWFNFGGLSCDYEDTRSADNGWTYYRVTDQRFPDYRSFLDYLGSIFSQEIVEELMADRVFADFDGQLYCLDGTRGADIFISQVDYSTKSAEENKIVYLASVTYIKDPSQDPPETDYVKDYEFVRERMDGEWVFTAFPYFY